MEELKLNSLIEKYNFVVGIMILLPTAKRTEETFSKLLTKYETFRNKIVKKSSVRLILDDVEYCIKNINELVDVDQEVYNEERNPWDLSLSNSVIKSIIVKHYLKDF